MKTFGLIGKSLSYSFSSRYFNKKFYKEGVTDTEYLNFELKDINEFPQLIKKQNLIKHLKVYKQTKVIKNPKFDQKSKFYQKSLI